MLQVDEIRTSDNGLVRVKLMIFHEISDVDTMVRLFLLEDSNHLMSLNPVCFYIKRTSNLCNFLFKSDCLYGATGGMHVTYM